jgi:hypothetical protein
MWFRNFVLIFIVAASMNVHSQQAAFNRFTEDLPQLLETDASTVMVRGMTHNFAIKLCARLGTNTSKDVQNEVAAWVQRNDKFSKAASNALNEIANRHLPVGGEPARQGYLQMLLQTTGKTANQRLMQQLNGANLDNNVIPPDIACAGFARMLQDKLADFENTPNVTRALTVYMQKQGTQISNAVPVDPAIESRDAATGYVGHTNFLVGRVGRDCLSLLNRKETSQEFASMWQQKNWKYVSAASKHMEARLNEAQASGGAQKRDALLRAITTPSQTSAAAMVKSWLEQGDKTEACKRAILLIESGAYDITKSSPMFAELEALSAWGK